VKSRIPEGMVMDFNNMGLILKNGNFIVGNFFVF